MSLYVMHVIISGICSSPNKKSRWHAEFDELGMCNTWQERSRFHSKLKTICLILPCYTIEFLDSLGGWPVQIAHDFQG